MSISDWARFGVGFGLGRAYPGLLWRNVQPPVLESVIQACDRCRQFISDDALFCVHCGQPVHAVGRCVECGVGLLPGARFCHHCGAEVQASDCPECGFKPPPGSKFCTRCGAALSAEARSDG